MAWEETAGVFEAGRSLEHGYREVPNQSHHCDHKPIEGTGDQRPWPSHKHGPGRCCQHRSKTASHQTLQGLFRAQLHKLRLSEALPHKVCEDVCRNDREHGPPLHECTTAKEVSRGGRELRDDWPLPCSGGRRQELCQDRGGLQRAKLAQAHPERRHVPQVIDAHECGRHIVHRQWWSLLLDAKCASSQHEVDNGNSAGEREKSIT
mmetsp:Transcript_90983/g.157928  ORF Transcript_90983/g.157928 Transcript_90983/m.157928 type:complete len:206 (-) Transcript_90983:114-731(-)